MNRRNLRALLRTVLSALAALRPAGRAVAGHRGDRPLCRLTRETTDTEPTDP